MAVGCIIFQGRATRQIRATLPVSNPALAKDIVYKPKRIFMNASKEKRVYNEMWTGTRWEETQVSTSVFNTD